MASVLDILDAQVSLVSRFVKENFLKLNTQSLSVVFASNSHVAYPECKVRSRSFQLEVRVSASAIGGEET